ncbi:hypothetical protein HELRODRAFT_173604 [Helobdella robusta]|uniref:Nucleotide-diphospho-sugar transferase domain-containing protein n=1 Tax=Helobdella robusta TaxID=6412 RepID=T1F710_HELRO|nr:hypothetical protein HELRODRAFT_173604 [Helobdella robusta]ESO03318.1 hypothetical protein HELRODRAFT_173604 [Helobdella robusta]
MLICTRKFLSYKILYFGALTLLCITLLDYVNENFDVSNKQFSEDDYSYSSQIKSFYSKHHEKENDNAFIKAISKYAKTIPKKFDNETDQRFIILALTDNAFFDMALNLYLTSFQKFGITNFLFVGVGKIACQNLLNLNIQCYYFTEASNSNESMAYGSRQFALKVNIRTDMIIEALKANYVVLHTDVDVMFLNNPMPYIEQQILKNSNMAVLWDYHEYNSGFLVIKPSKFSIELYMTMQEITNKSDSLDDQKALNMAIKSLRTKYKDNPEIVQIGILEKSKFLSGKNYFEEVDRNFPTQNGSNNCPSCLVMHNNWIKTMDAKVYRFKEALLWAVDKDRYYSDEKRKYLLYNNPFLNNPPNNYSTDKAELNALKTGFALAQMLNRTLIIPRFHCHGPKNPYECSIIHWIYVKELNKQFSYRENSFLLNPLVPKSIRKIRGCSEPIWTFIETNTSLGINDLIQNSYSKIVSIDLKNYTKVPEKVILKIFSNCDDKVLYVASLLGVEVVFDSANEKDKYLSFFYKLKLSQENQFKTAKELEMGIEPRAKGQLSIAIYGLAYPVATDLAA